MHVEDYNADTNFVTEVYPQPLPQAACGPAPIYVDGTTLENHLFALVTQTTRGEVAVVDLTAGNVVDIDNSTPGINFLPVGKNPTDIASAPDGTFTYVAAAEPGKPAIYALDSRVILGNSRAFDFDLSTIPDGGGAPQPFVIPTLTTWPACSLPQAPGAMSIVPAPTVATDGGATDADAGATTSNAYTIAVVLPGDEVSSAKLLTLDPAQFTDGSIGPGSLTSCKILSSIELSSAAPTTWSAGPTWDDGIRADGGFNEKTTTLDAGADAAPTTTVTFPAGVGDPPAAASCSTFDAGSGVNTIPDVPVLAPRGGFMARDATTLYIADENIAMIHVIDVSNPNAPHENAPLLATSQLDPARRVTVGQIAVSQPTRDYRRYLYAIDQNDSGSIMVFDVSNPSATARVPLTRPHPEINPFLPPDRISFSYPVATITFASHDYSPVATGTALERGILCNPNKEAGFSFPTSAAGVGAYYRANADPTNTSFGIEGAVGLGPYRLRGVFGFATLTNGSVVILDVDDWDAPCRRPDPMGNDPLDDEYPSTTPTPLISSLTPNEPGHSSTSDIDEYHAPVAYGDRFQYSTAVGAGITTGTSNETFFPVSAPNRLRSQYLLSNNLSTGLNVPHITSTPILSQITGGNPTPLSVAGIPGSANPMMVPTYSELNDTSYDSAQNAADPSQRNPTFPNGATSAQDKRIAQPIIDAQPGVRISWEDPTAHYNQNWLVTYEGVLPGFSGTPGQSGVSGNLSTTNGFNSLSVDTGPNMCRRGVEDAQVGAERADEYLAAITKYGISPPSRLDHRVADYVQLSEDLISPSDPYWAEDDSNEPGGTCWDWDPNHPLPPSNPGDRYNTCQAIYGYAGDQSIQRDFPIWQAFDDHFVLGRYGYTDSTENPATREVVGPDASNVASMKAMMCCFHRAVQFHVRTGGEWLAAGSVLGLLHHVTKDSNNACVQSCDPRESLLNARSIGLSRAGLSFGDDGLTPPDRNSILAMRNPMFAYLMWNGVDATGKIDIPPARDMQWSFGMQGQFTPLAINYAGTTTSAVSPQSMLFLESFGRIAVVDGSSAGLVLLDLQNITVNGGPYY